jgi:hypothetical protein
MAAPVLGIMETFRKTSLWTAYKAPFSTVVLRGCHLDHAENTDHLLCRMAIT